MDFTIGSTYFKSEVLKCALEWTPAKVEHLPTSANMNQGPRVGHVHVKPREKMNVIVASQYRCVKDYVTFWRGMILGDFLLDIDEEWKLPMGQPVGFTAFLEKKRESETIVSYATEGVQSDERLLALPRTGFCFLAASKGLIPGRLYMSDRCADIFEQGTRCSEPHFTCLNFFQCLKRMEAIEYVGETPWLDRILNGTCVYPFQYRPTNECHADAITEFLHGPPGIYIWQGPPGTGKTKAIAQLVQTLRLQYYNSMGCVLICAHSNEAVSNVIDKLIQAGVDQREIFWSVSEERLQEVQYTTNEKKMINKMTEKSRIFVSTCARAHLLGKTVSLVILDEAAFCPEHDGMIPFMSLDFRHWISKYLLVGDCEQLPPVMKMFTKPQICCSFMGRCCTMSPSCVTAFDVTYRLGPACVSFLKQSIYRNIPNFRCANPTVPPVCILAGGKAFPELTFLDVHQGVETRNGASWTNEAEAATVSNVVFSLLKNGVSIRELIILTPYSAQAKIVRSLLKKHKKDRDVDAKDVKVSTVHEMQGSERKFIILNTVRTDFTGFIDESTLMCVSISRQNVFLVVIGNASFLAAHTSYWKSFIEFLHKDGNVVDPSDFKFGR